MLVVIVCAIATHILFTEALKYAPASTLQPFNFLALPVAVLLSFLFFGYITDIITVVGGAVTIAAGVMVWVRERKRNIIKPNLTGVKLSNIKPVLADHSY
ncbi:hypothetical protein PsW64_03188 [Pseudovibrio sp. W64]|nr:hypothetical protein PsW64_03188 [Pseudovibrio sp. W64]